MVETYRQGDVLLVKVDEIPSAAKPVKRDAGKIILAYGEVTGHSHSIAATRVKFLQVPDGARFLSSDTAFSVNHEEHATVKVPAGTFQVIRQREYARGEIRDVAD